MIQEESYEVFNNIPLTCFTSVKDAQLFLIHTKYEWDVFFEALMKEKIVACDTETTGLHWFNPDHHICGLSFGWRNTHFYIPCRHVVSLSGGEPIEQLDFEYIKDDLIRFFSRKDVVLVFHNFKFDALMYKKEGVEIPAFVHDTFLFWKFYNENSPASLKAISSGWKDIMGIEHAGVVSDAAKNAEKALSEWRTKEASERRKFLTNIVKEKVEELVREPKYQGWKKLDLRKFVKETYFGDHEYFNAKKADIHYGMIPIPLMCEYAALDTYLTYQVYVFLKNENFFTDKSIKLYKMELDLLRVLIYTETRGMYIDREYLIHLNERLTEEIVQLEEEIHHELGDININSTKQLAQNLREKGVVFTKLTKTGQPCLDASVLKKLAPKYEIIHKILELRTKQKLKGTYVEAILRYTTNTGIIYPSFNQIVATGRMSSAGVINFQNQPQGGIIRNAFIVPPK